MPVNILSLKKVRSKWNRVGRTKRFTYFFRSKESLRNLKYPQREDLGFSTITVQLLLMAKILDCALAPTNKAEKHRQE